MALAFWGGKWTFAGWCEMRRDFRGFRVDRMSDVAAGGAFPAVSGCQLKDYLATLKRDWPDVNEATARPSQ